MKFALILEGDWKKCLDAEYEYYASQGFEYDVASATIDGKSRFYYRKR